MSQKLIEAVKELLATIERQYVRDDIYGSFIEQTHNNAVNISWAYLKHNFDNVSNILRDILTVPYGAKPKFEMNIEDFGMINEHRIKLINLAEEMKQELLSDWSFDHKSESPHWHEYNPWKDNLMYVKPEELASCVLLGSTRGDWSPEKIVDHWRQDGSNMRHKIDAYILLPGWNGRTNYISAGIRYGKEGEEYLSPSFEQTKIRELINNYLRYKG
jgi:hypothetical protein